jgi:hypothetical protein
MAHLSYFSFLKMETVFPSEASANYQAARSKFSKNASRMRTRRKELGLWLALRHRGQGTHPSH